MSCQIGCDVRGWDRGWVQGPFLGSCKFCASSCSSKLGVSGLDSGRLWICLLDMILPEIFWKLYWPGAVGQLCRRALCTFQGARFHACECLGYVRWTLHPYRVGGQPNDPKPYTAIIGV